MTRIAVTGAAGMVGRQTLESLRTDPGYDVTPITHRDHDDIDSVILDVEDSDAVEEALEGHDVVVHLAANPSAYASWEDVLHTNIDGTRNVYEAAVTHEIERVVFASSNHTTMMYNTKDEIGSLDQGDLRVVHPEDPPRPDSYYGISKVTGEALGLYYATRHGIDVVNLRIGWLLDGDELEEKQAGTEEEARFARTLWLSPRDCRDAMRCAVESDLSDNPVTVHILSRNSDRFLSLTSTIQAIGYEPRDDAEEFLRRG